MKKLFIFLLFHLFLLVNKTEASHIVGADISYKCVGVNTYEFTLSVYRDCDGIPVQPTYKLDYSSFSCNFQGNITLSQPHEPIEISPVCAAESSSCNGGLQPGVQQYVYKGILILPVACSDWVFSWTDCTRNHEITNIQNPHGTCLHVEATLNNLVAPCNSSPVFSNPPVSFICKGQGNFINPGTIEEDGDQLKFSVVTPKSGKLATVKYIAPFSATNPLSSSKAFSINSISGDISVYPANDKEVSVISIVAEERRGGVLIGSVMRDVQLITRNCNNDNPVLSGINNTSSDSIRVCYGTQVCFDVFGSDPNGGQILTMSWNQPFEASVSKFIVTGTETKPKANICWTPDSSDIGLNLITVTLTDDFCPIVGSTTKSYKIRVLPNPIPQLPSDSIIPCEKTVVLPSNVILGKAPYTYKWNTGETTSVVTKGPGEYSVKVTDVNGCIGNDTIDINAGVFTGFDQNKLCVGHSAQFIDTSYSLVGNIVSWTWNFGDPASGLNNTSSIKNPTHIFSTNKVFTITLTVTDNFGCQGTIIKEIDICDIPRPDFMNMDSCQGQSIRYLDLTTVQNCDIVKYTLNVGGRTHIFEYLDPHVPGSDTLVDDPLGAGDYLVTLTAENVNGCTNSKSHTIHINPQPQVTITENDYYFNCSKPDSIFHGIVLQTGKLPFSRAWSTGATTSNIPVNKQGAYTFSITDANGCSHSATRKVMDPIVPVLEHNPICESSSPVQFIDNSFSAWGIVKWDYKFDDGTSFSTTNSSQRNPSHLYPNGDVVYNPKLIVRDAKGCIDSIVKGINYEFPDNHFLIEPEFQCLGQFMRFESPSGSFIDSIMWTFGNGDSMKVGQYYKGKPTNQLLLGKKAIGIDTIYDYKGRYTYPSGAGMTFPFKMEMWYNNKTCTRTYTKNINLFPSLKVDIDSIHGFCSNDTTYFYANQKNSVGGTNAVNSWKWKFYSQQQVPPYTLHLIDSSNVQNPKKIFTENGNHFADLTVTNGDGCELVLTRKGFSVVKLPKPYFCTLNNCATQRAHFFSFCNSFPEVVIDSIYWDFGDGDFSNVREPFHIYADSGTYNITVKIFNTSFGCMEDTTQTVRVYPIPNANFNADTVCDGQMMSLTDLSTPAVNDQIKSWQWSFGDGETSLDVNPRHLFPDSGTYNVELVVTSLISGCTDSISKPVVVKPSPEAGFTTSINELVTEHPVLFVDQSSGAIKWLWHFGDGDSILITDPTNTSPYHIYNDTVYRAVIQQVVYNKYGCTDTARMDADLNVYFILPEAFSPNGDGNNDGFYPTFKGVKEILEFRVYDRWGQKIYEREGDLLAHWDGKYKGVEQPVGVYVYYARAITFNNQEIIRSGKVTLIR